MVRHTVAVPRLAAGWQWVVLVAGLLALLTGIAAAWVALGPSAVTSRSEDAVTGDQPERVITKYPGPLHVMEESGPERVITKYPGPLHVMEGE